MRILFVYVTENINFALKTVRMNYGCRVLYLYVYNQMKYIHRSVRVIQNSTVCDDTSEVCSKNSRIFQFFFLQCLPTSYWDLSPRAVERTSIAPLAENKFAPSLSITLKINGRFFLIVIFELRTPLVEIASFV